MLKINYQWFYIRIQNGSLISSLEKPWVTGYSILFTSFLTLQLKIRTSKFHTSKKWYSSTELATIGT